MRLGKLLLLGSSIGDGAANDIAESRGLLQVGGTNGQVEGIFIR